MQARVATVTFENQNTFLTYSQEGREAEYHDAYEAAVETVRGQLGQDYPLRIGGDRITTEETFEVVNPANTDEAIGTFAAATDKEVDLAVRAAGEAFEAWRATQYADRADVFERAADVMEDRLFELAAWMTLENGKNRHEAVADVDEAIDFLRFYAYELRRHEGYAIDTGEPAPGEHCESVLRPYGVFAVVSPFNFPLAILTGMTTGATLVGNTAVVKPASATPAIAHRFFDVLEEAGLPDGVANLVTGSGSTAGQPLIEHEDVAGCVFTGSREVGKRIQRIFVDKGGPVIAELGGKNAVVVTDNADLDNAVEGTWKAAFGFGGQKCSACSRAFVHADLYEDFVERLVEAAEEIAVGAPEERETFVGPVIEERKVREFKEAVELAKRDGGRILAGGEVLTGDGYSGGHFVAPAVVEGLPTDHELFYEELFLPFVTVAPYRTFDEAIALVNATDYGLTGGIFSEDEVEVEAFFDRVEVGVAYANRTKSATTGALVQGQPFGGWKDSGITGKAAGGVWYLPQFLREQTRTVVRE